MLAFLISFFENKSEVIKYARIIFEKGEIKFKNVLEDIYEMLGNSSIFKFERLILQVPENKTKAKTVITKGRIISEYLIRAFFPHKRIAKMQTKKRAETEKGLKEKSELNSTKNKNSTELIKAVKRLYIKTENIMILLNVFPATFSVIINKSEVLNLLKR